MSNVKRPKFATRSSSSKHSVQPNANFNLHADLDPRLKVVKSCTDKGDYERALSVIPGNSMEPEIQNCRAVCHMRLNRFSHAIGPLRMAALDTSTFHLRNSTPSHIKINFSFALFFGGEPAGGLETLGEIRMEDDSEVKKLRAYAKLWASEMSFFQRIDWQLNRIAPKRGPLPPAEQVGRFVWDLASELSHRI